MLPQGGAKPNLSLHQAVGPPLATTVQKQNDWPAL
jgi:hypothetical protein